MPRLPRPTGKQLIRFLEERGFSIIRVRGSHHVMQRAHARTTVPAHANTNIKIGTLRGILRDIGITPSEFEYLWERRN